MEEVHCGGEGPHWALVPREEEEIYTVHSDVVDHVERESNKVRITHKYEYK